MQFEQRYYEMFAKFNAGEITEKEWRKFCKECMNEVLAAANTLKVLKRLRNR